MDEDVMLNHVALQYSNKKHADVFFTEILGIPKKKSYMLSQELSQDIFDIASETEIVVYSNAHIRFEIFISKEKNKTDFAHTCIEVKDRKKFIKLCEEKGLYPQIIKKDEKILLFVRDFSHNLYEIKENMNL
jgi:hypothetical protein